MWKLHTDIVADDLGEIDLLLKDQKGCCRNSIGTKDLWLIDKVIMKNCSRMARFSMV